MWNNDTQKCYVFTLREKKLMLLNIKISQKGEKQKQNISLCKKSLLECTPT